MNMNLLLAVLLKYLKAKKKKLNAMFIKVFIYKDKFISATY